MSLQLPILHQALSEWPLALMAPMVYTGGVGGYEIHLWTATLQKGCRCRVAVTIRHSCATPQVPHQNLLIWLILLKDRITFNPLVDYSWFLAFSGLGLLLCVINTPPNPCQYITHYIILCVHFFCKYTTNVKIQSEIPVGLPVNMFNNYFPHCVFHVSSSWRNKVSICLLKL